MHGCLEDNDCDGVPNQVEVDLGSDPDNPQSTPEHLVYDQLTCTDGVDNDLDGQTDHLDSGCQIPTPTPEIIVEGAVRSQGDSGAPADSFGFDGDHAFSMSTATAVAHWLALREAASMVDDVDTETDTDRPDRVVPMDVARTKQLLRQLIGGVGQAVADSELMEAEQHPELVAADDLASARSMMDDGDASLAETSQLNGTSADLLAALESYQGVFELLAPLLHEAQNRAPRGDLNCDGEITSVDALFALRWVVGLGEAECLSAGDVNCDLVINSVDGLFLLREVAGLGVNLPAGCPALGNA